MYGLEEWSPCRSLSSLGGGPQLPSFGNCGKPGTPFYRLPLAVGRGSNPLKTRSGIQNSAYRPGSYLELETGARAPVSVIGSVLLINRRFPRLRRASVGASSLRITNLRVERASAN